MKVIFSYEVYDGRVGGLRSYELYNDASILAKDIDNKNPFIIKIFNEDLIQIGQWDNESYEWIKSMKDIGLLNRQCQPYFLSDEFEERIKRYLTFQEYLPTYFDKLEFYRLTRDMFKMK